MLAKTMDANMITADAGPECEANTLALISRLVEEAENIGLIVIAEQTSELGACSGLLHQLLKEHEKVQFVLLNGEHTIAQKMLMILKARTHENLSNADQEKLITDFAANK